MYIKAHNKFLRKYDADFWNFLYHKRRKNKFFTYFRLSVINKIQKYFKHKIFFIHKKNKRLKIKFMKNTNFFTNFMKIKTISNFKLFKRSKFFVKRVFLKYVNPKKNKSDILFGIKSAFKHYKQKITSTFSRFKTYLKHIILFYNNLNKKKLLKFSNLTKKSKLGSINYFFYKLESRLDSILIRLNISTRFFTKTLIKDKLVLVNNIKINYLNYIVSPMILFLLNRKLKKKYIYLFLKILKQNVFLLNLLIF